MKDDMIPGKVNFLGRRGEHMTRVKRFYTGDVLRDYPGAEITVLNKRPGDTGSYPVAGAYCVMDGDWLEWTVQSGDLATEGFGKCEMRATVNGQIALSIVYTTEVKESLDGAEEPPEPWESWVQDVTDAADRAEAAAQLLENPGAEAVTLEAGSQATAEYEDGTFTFGIPRGPKGEDGADGADGYSPSAVVSKSGGVATVTITDKNGTTSAEIRDGTDGQDGITPAFSIGTVQKGTNAAATITGTPAAPVLNLTLPKGDKGNTGNTGPTGATPEISIGTVETGAAGSQAAATITGTAAAPVLNLTIPRGDKGETGEVSEAEMTAAIAAASSELKSEIDRKAPVILRDASGNIVSFADGADNMPLKECTVAVDPVQDLHGQDAPYPAGATANLIPDGQDTNKGYIAGKYIAKDGVAKNSSGNYISEWFPVLPETQYVYSAKINQTVAAICFFDSNKDYISGVNFTDDGTTAKLISVTTPSGAAYARATQAYANSDLLQFELGSTGTTIKPYSNICPITGHTGANIYRTGVNLLPMPITSGSYDYTMTVSVNADKSFYVTKTSGTGWTRFDICTNLFLPAGTYTFIESDDGSSNASCSIDNAKTGESITNTRYVKTRTMTFDTGVYLNINYARAAIADNVLTKLMLFRGSTATAADYTPYVGSVYPISWQTAAGTVYGGTLDALTGVLTVTHTILEYDASSDEGWLKVDGVTGYYFPGAFPKTVNTSVKPIDNIFKWNSNSRSTMSNLADGEIAFSPSGEQINIKSSAFETLDAFKAYIAEHPLRIVAQLYNFARQTYQLDPVQITALKESNIWSDTGEISMTYPADTTLYVQKELAVSRSLMELIITANHESGMTASKAYSSGDLLIVNGTLYKATTSIATGGTLTVGTNVTATTVANELAALA